MNKTIARLLLAGILIAFASVEAASEEDDPCDFASSHTGAFSWHQVMACYESVPFFRSDLEQIVGVLRENRPFSDLSELYDERYAWRERLEALLETDFRNDFEMHNALRAEHIAMQNPHVRYYGPACYNGLLTAFIPFDFGSTIWPRDRGQRKGSNQIIFIEGAPFSPGLYRQHTGIEPETFVGLKVLKIDNVPALKYFREYGRERVSLGSHDSSNLMNIINRRQMFSLRGSALSSPHPRKPFVAMMLQKRNGEIITVAFPWLFGVRSRLGYRPSIPLTKSTEEFHALCLQRRDDVGPGGPGATARGGPPFGLGIPSDHEMMIAKMRENRERKSALAKSRSGSFHEVPPEELDRDIEVIHRRSPFAHGFQYKGDTTVLRLFNTLPFYLPARITIAHACEHSKRLIIDVRSSDGGLDDPVVWLYRHLIDEGDAPVEELGKVAFRGRTDPSLKNRFLRFASEFGFRLVEDLGAPPDICEFATEQQCWQDLDAPEQRLIPHTEVDWFERGTINEIRAGESVPLTRRIGLGESIHKTAVGFLPPKNVSECRDKFLHDDLIILTDGANCSGSYFMLEPFIDNGVATVVTMGGYASDPDREVEVGICRTGPNFPVDHARQAIDGIEALSDGNSTMDRPIPTRFARNVISFMEIYAAYRGSSDELHWDVPLTYDIRLNLWSDSPETDGYVYGKVLEAVDAFYADAR